MKGKNKYLQNNRAKSFSSVSRLVIEQLALENIFKYRKDNEVIRSS